MIKVGSKIICLKNINNYWTNSTEIISVKIRLYISQFDYKFINPATINKIRLTNKLFKIYNTYIFKITLTLDGYFYSTQSWYNRIYFF